MSAFHPLRTFPDYGKCDGTTAIGSSMLRFSALVAALFGSQSAASAQTLPPVINAPLNSMLHVVFEEGQPNFSSAQNIVIREVVRSAKSGPVAQWCFAIVLVQTASLIFGS
jgi:hypothetical protein